MRMTATTTLAPLDSNDRPSSNPIALLVLAAAGGAVATALGVYGRVHSPTGGQIFDLGFPTMKAMKAFLATIAVGLVVVQIASALAMFGRLPFLRRRRRWVPFLHRWSGTTAFVVSLPVAYHCLWALGLQTNQTRPLVHGLFGCAFYGAMTTKLLGLRAEAPAALGDPGVRFAAGAHPDRRVAHIGLVVLHRPRPDPLLTRSDPAFDVSGPYAERQQSTAFLTHQCLTAAAPHRGANRQTQCAR